MEPQLPHRAQWLLLVLWCVLCPACASLDSSLSSDPLDADSYRVLSRHRRFFLPSASGWLVYATFSVIVPFSSFSPKLTIQMPFLYQFDTGAVSGREFSTHEKNRQSLIENVEAYLARFMGVDGHACMLRTLCEMAQVPSHSDGLFGDVANLLLAPAHLIDKLGSMAASSNNEYIRAQSDGRIWNDCSAYTQKCPYSFFEFVESQKGLAPSNTSLPLEAAFTGDAHYDEDAYLVDTNS